MAVKVIAQISGQFTVDGNGDVSIPVYMKALGSGSDGVGTYGPVAPSQCTEANLVAWIKSYTNQYFDAQVGVLDTVKLISGIGGLL